MTWLDVILYGPGWLAFTVVVVDWCLERRSRRRYQKRRTPHASYQLRWPTRSGVITAGPLSKAEFEALTAHLEREFSRYRDDRATPVMLLNDEEKP